VAAGLPPHAICGEARGLHDSWVALSRTTPSASPVKEIRGPRLSRDGTTHEPLKDLFNGKDGQAQMLESIGIHLTIAGECYLIGRTTRTEDEDGNIYDQGEVWEIVSVLEVKVTGTNWSIDYGDGHPVVNLSEGRHCHSYLATKSRQAQADSPFRSLPDPVGDRVADLPHLRSTVFTPGRCWQSSRRV